MHKKQFLFFLLTLSLIGATSLNSYQRIMVAVKKGDLAGVQRVINVSKGINLSKPINDYGQTILHIAAGQYGKYPDSPAICRALIAAGADKNALDIDAFTPLSAAIHDSNKPVVESLLNAGADPNRGAVMGDSLLIATQKGQLDVVQLLISAGVDIKGKRGGSALAAAAQAGNIEIMNVLIVAGANVNAVDNVNRTALHWWCYRGKHEIKALRLLLASGADVNALDQWRRTPIMFLLTSENDIMPGTLLFALRILIDAGSDLMAKNDYGDSAMTLGLRNTDAEVVTLLKESQVKLK